MMNWLFENAEIRDYNGFEHRVFRLDGNEANVILPKAENANGKWIWRVEFLGSFDWVDIDMLNRGYALAYYSVSDMYGCPEAVEMMKKFHDFMTDDLGFSKKTIPEGFSRGGLYSFNFAIKYPDLVSVIYLDAPVLDIKSWPSGMGKAECCPKQYYECLYSYGLTEDTIRDFRGNPVDRADEFAALGIPLVLVAGDADIDVPYDENAEILAAAYRRAGTPMLYIVKPGCEHHPHSLSDPKELTDFMAQY